MATKLRKALKLAEDSSFTKSPKVCKNQCSVLKDALVLVANLLKVISVRLEQPIDADCLVWEELALIVSRGLRLVQSYTDRKWIFTALVHEESREDFEDVRADLYDCIQLVSSLLPGLSLEDLRTRLVTTNLRNAAVEDRKQLVEMAFTGAGGRDLEAMTFLSGKLLSSEGSNAQLMVDHKQINLKKLLGSGSYSTVYEATWLGYLFAVKVFHPGDSTFPRELAALALSKHPNILRVVGSSYTDKQQRYLIMEMMEIDMESLVKKLNLRRRQLDGGCPLPLITMVSIMLQVAKAMAWLHSMNIIHRDLKPQNVLLRGKDNEGYRAKVADFGLARTQFITSRVSYASSKRGTKGYAAPEVWETSSHQYSKKSDVYSYGILCYHLFTGKTPFKTSDLMSPDFMERVRGGMRPEFHAECHPELAGLIQSCWATEAIQRPLFSEVIDKLKLIRAAIVSSKVC